MRARWNRWPWLPFLGGALIGILVYIALAKATPQLPRPTDRGGTRTTVSGSAN